MKYIIIGIAASAISFGACNTVSNKTGDNKVSTDTTKPQEPANNTRPKDAGSIKEIVSGYLQLKNALVNDDGGGAATGGKAILSAVGKFDNSSLSAQQKKVYDDIADDLKDNAEHISQNSHNIAHQRQHFDMMGKDIYDLIKTFPQESILYKDSCPIFNNGQGATWVSETKEIKNPYLGKKMPSCGQVKEEIK